MKTTSWFSKARWGLKLLAAISFLYLGVSILAEAGTSGWGLESRLGILFLIPIAVVLLLAEERSAKSSKSKIYYGHVFVDNKIVICPTCKAPIDYASSTSKDSALLFCLVNDSEMKGKFPLLLPEQVSPFSNLKGNEQRCVIENPKMVEVYMKVVLDLIENYLEAQNLNSEVTSGATEDGKPGLEQRMSNTIGQSTEKDKTFDRKLDMSNQQSMNEGLGAEKLEGQEKLTITGSTKTKVHEKAESTSSKVEKLQGKVTEDAMKNFQQKAESKDNKIDMLLKQAEAAVDSMKGFQEMAESTMGKMEKSGAEAMNKGLPEKVSVNDPKGGFPKQCRARSNFQGHKRNGERCQELVVQI